MISGGDSPSVPGGPSLVSEDDVLNALESEAISILRETAAAFRKPVLMHSIGKDSSALLHLARKAFWPGAIPFPFLHVDSQWEFREVIEHRDRMAAELRLDLIVAVSEEGIAEGGQPDESRHPRVHADHAHRPAALGPGRGRIRRGHRRRSAGLRAFPLSNWTELDVWRYIRREGIDVVGLYFAQERPVVVRDGQLIVPDDDRMPLEPRSTCASMVR